MCVPCEYHMCSSCKRSAAITPNRPEASTPKAVSSRSQAAKLDFCPLPNLQQTLARECFDNINDGTKCPKEHPLKVFPIEGTRRIRCSACQDTMKGRCLMCVPCDFFLCSDCQTAFARSALAQQSEPIAVTEFTANSFVDARSAPTLRSALVTTNLQRWSRHCEQQWEDGWAEVKDMLNCDNEAYCHPNCELLGQGKYGVVHRLREPKTGHFRVIKTCQASPGWGSARLTLEAKILQNLDHPHVLRIFAWYEYGDTLSMIMDDCRGGELLKVVKAGRQANEIIPEAWVATSMRQSFSALAYIHSKGLVHKDVKGANLLLQYPVESSHRVFAAPPHIIVCDFGLAELLQAGGRWTKGDKATKAAGTPATRAPEVLTSTFSFKADIWSMGVVLFEMFTNELPFEAEASKVDDEKTWNDLYRKGPDWSIFPAALQGTTGDAQSLCVKMLTVKEASRPTALECLRHPWSIKHQRSNLSPYDLESMTSAFLAWPSKSPLQQAFCLWMASGPAGAASLKKCATLFSQFDTENAGILSNERVFEGLVGTLGMEAEDGLSVARALDVSGVGACGYFEFSAGCLSCLEEIYDDLLFKAFSHLDPDNKEYLTKSDLVAFFEDLAPLISNIATLKKEMTSIANSANALSIESFCKYFGREGVDYAKLSQARSPTNRKKEKEAAMKKLPKAKTSAAVKPKAKLPTSKAQAKTIEAPPLPDACHLKANAKDSKSKDGRGDLSSSSSNEALVPCTPSKPSFFFSI